MLTACLSCVKLPLCFQRMLPGVVDKYFSRCNSVTQQIHTCKFQLFTFAKLTFRKFEGDTRSFFLKNEVKAAGSENPNP